MNEEIKTGFKLRGTLDILGQTVKVDIEIGVPFDFTIIGEMTPLRIGTALALTRKPNDFSTGPKLYIKLSLPDEVNSCYSDFIFWHSFIFGG